MKTKWQQPEQLQQLVCELVSWDSRTGTEGEIQFPYRLKDKLLELPYFQEKQNLIDLHGTGDDRNVLTALYKNNKTKRTIVLMSHFDTVHTSNFGKYEPLAFQPEKLTEALQQDIQYMPTEIQTDLHANDYLFGRGIMDMKMGLALHMNIIEKASIENWPINILLVTVPDEEVDSVGMRAAVKKLVDIQQEHALTYELFLNSEPSLTETSEDPTHYVYSGSIGKLMPAALFYGKETHAGQPLQGITSHYMAAYLTKEMELNEAFLETDFDEVTPLPICLQQNDLKRDYSTQTSPHSYALYNVFTMNRTAKETMNIYKQIAQRAMTECQKDYETICNKHHTEPIGKINVLDYEQLLSYAKQKLDPKTITNTMTTINNDETLDDRQKSIYICDTIMSYCDELTPTTILFFAPPYYPAVNTSEHPTVKKIITKTKQILQNKFNVQTKQIHYFNGISDLSYVHYNDPNNEWKTYRNNSPVWGDIYDIPFEQMKQLQAPVINIGPYGKDAHKMTERLHKKSAFIHTPYVLHKIIKGMFD